MSFHIEAAPGEVADTILITGDPLRAKFIAESMLKDVFCYNHVRGMLGFTGLYKETRVSLQGTGMGIPSTAIYVHELIREYNVKRLIRIGTCGAIQPHLLLGQIIAADSAFTDSAAYRMDADTMEKGVPAHPGLLTRAKAVATTLNIPMVTGAIFSTDMFYDDPVRWKHWSQRGVLAIEMETSVIYTLAQRNGVEALTLLTVSDNILDGQAMSAAARQESGRDIMRLALETAVS